MTSQAKALQLGFQGINATELLGDKQRPLLIMEVESQVKGTTCGSRLRPRSVPHRQAHCLRHHGAGGSLSFTEGLSSVPGNRPPTKQSASLPPSRLCLRTSNRRSGKAGRLNKRCLVTVRRDRGATRTPVGEASSAEGANYPPAHRQGGAWGCLSRESG